MSPYEFDEFAQVAIVKYDNILDSHSVNFPLGVRPVINLRSDVQLTGTGTTGDPFKVVGAS